LNLRNTGNEVEGLENLRNIGIVVEGLENDMQKICSLDELYVCEIWYVWSKIKIILDQVVNL